MWLRFTRGRQESGYEKMLLMTAPWPIPFDMYILRFRVGDHIPPHTDPVTNRRHYRLNIVVRKASEGGEFLCEDAIFETERIKFFRPDRSRHAVSQIVRGSRWVLSVGFVLRQRHANG
jgi:hypothetical protein